MSFGFRCNTGCETLTARLEVLVAAFSFVGAMDPGVLPENIYLFGIKNFFHRHDYHRAVSNTITVSFCRVCRIHVKIYSSLTLKLKTRRSCC